MPRGKPNGRVAIPKPEYIKELSADEARRWIGSETKGPPYFEKEERCDRFWCRYPNCNYHANRKGNVSQHYRESHLALRNRSSRLCEFCDFEAPSLAKHYSTGAHENGVGKVACYNACSRAWFVEKGGRPTYHLRYCCPRREDRLLLQHDRVWNPKAATDPSAPTFNRVDPVRTASLPMQSDSNAPSNQRLSSSYQLSDQFLQPHVDYSWENVTLDPQLVGGFGSQSFTSAWNDHSNNFGPPQQLSDHHETRSTSRIQPQSWEVFHGQAEPPLSHLEYSHPNVLLDFPPQTHAANTSLPYSIPSQCSTMHLPPYDSSSFPPLSCYSHSANIASQPDPRHLDQAALSNSRLSPSSATFDQRGFLNSIPTPSPPHHQFSLKKAQRFRLTQRQALRYDQTYTRF